MFLDRDGVITRAVVRAGRPYAPRTLDELVVLPGVPAALQRLRAVGFRVVVVTNQPEIARGTLPHAVVEAMHRRLRHELPLDDIQLCPHDDVDGCGCRKPASGLLEAAAAAFNLRLGASFMVGDRWRDIEAGHRAGCTNVFIDCGYDEPRPQGADATVGSLPEAVEWILAREGSVS